MADRTPALEPEPEPPPVELEVPLAQRIAAAMAEAGEVTKAARNPEQNYNYATAEAILAAVRLPLLRRGIILLPEVVEAAEEEITSRSGSKGSRVRVTVRFTFTDGLETLVRSWVGEGQDYGDKAAAKAMTAAVKTFVRVAWLLPTEHDDPEATPAGERVTGGLPDWAAAASPARKRQMLEALDPMIGRDAGVALGRLVTDSIGHVPDVVVGFARELAKVVAARAQDAAAETPPAAPPGDPDAPTDIPIPDDPPIDDAPAPIVAPDDATLEQLLDLGCTCETPGSQPYAPDCPIAQHSDLPFEL
jgi:hypothetical protein